ncbi:MAG: hypothetical protein ACTSXX_04295, partial [Candidatus Baldrarchaeia archaeon]
TDARLVRTDTEYALRINLSATIEDTGGINCGIQDVVVVLAERNPVAKITGDNLLSGHVISDEALPWHIEIGGYDRIRFLNVTRESVRILDGGRKMEISGSFVVMDAAPPEYGAPVTKTKDRWEDYFDRLFVIVVVRDRDMNEVAFIVPLPGVKDPEPSFRAEYDPERSGLVKVLLPSPVPGTCERVTFVAEGGRVTFPVEHGGSIAVCPSSPWFLMVAEFEGVHVGLSADPFIPPLFFSLAVAGVLRACGLRYRRRRCWLLVLAWLYVTSLWVYYVI